MEKKRIGLVVRVMESRVGRVTNAEETQSMSAMNAMEKVKCDASGVMAEDGRNVRTVMVVEK